MESAAIAFVKRKKLGLDNGFFLRGQFFLLFLLSSWLVFFSFLPLFFCLSRLISFPEAPHRSESEFLTGS